MKCNSCGAIINDNYKYCIHCGAKLEIKENLIKVIRLGSSTDNDYVIQNKYVSRHHALIKLYSDEKIFIEDLNSKNGTFVNGRRIDKTFITLNDEIYLSKHYKLNLREVISSYKPIYIPKSINESNNVYYIGRASDNDIIINNIKVSRKHAKLENINGEWFIEDLGSLNHTYVNSKLIKRAKVTENDIITLGGIPFNLEKLLSLKGETKINVTLSTKNLSLILDGKTIVDRINLTILSGEFVGLIGPSGAGKTSLLLMMNNIIKPSMGDVLINKQSLLNNYEIFKGQIGYVPQDDIIHRELTVWESLYYTACLRLKNYSNKEILNQVNNVIETLKLEEAKDVIIGSPEKKGISGGQRKRVNLGQELITEPLILFLDEPTSGLDPKTDLDVMSLLKGIADKGKIVILTTHNITSENFKILTHLIVLTKGGKLAYFGPASLATDYFKVDNPYKIFEILNSKEPDFWQKKYLSSNYYEKHVLSRQENLKPVREEISIHKKSESGFDFRQFFLMTSRYLKVKLRDRFNTLILLLQAPLIALLISLVFSKEDEKIQALFVLVISSIWLGCSNAAREIVSEQSIFKRERMVFLKIPEYLLSKIFVLSILSFIQSLILVSITTYTLSFNGNFLEFLLLFLFVSITSISMGLFISSVVSSNEAAMGLTPIVLIPQVILGGLISKFSDMSEYIKILSGLMISRWAFEGSLIFEFKDRKNYLIENIGFNVENIAIDFIVIVFFFIAFLIATIFSLHKKSSFKS